MNCTAARDAFPSLLDDRLPAPDAAAVRAHLAACPDCRRDFASLEQTLAALDALPDASPSPQLRARFHTWLDAEKKSSASLAAPHPSALPAPRPSARRARFFSRLLSPLAGAALLALGFFAGTRYAPPASSAPAADPATARELAELRHRVDSMGQLVGYSLLLPHRSTTDRLKGVLASADRPDTADPRILSQLIGALALDPSVNVRLSALDALYPHAGQEAVRAGVLASLSREQNPLVQVAMIDFLVAARDRDAAPTLERFTRDATLDRSVRESARRALVQL